MKSIALIDIDGVILNVVKQFLVEMARIGIHLKEGDIDNWNIREILGFDDTSIIRASTETDLEPMAGACESLRLLHSMGYALHLVTSRPEDLREVTILNLKKHGISFDDITFQSDKARWAETHQPVFAVEDSISNAISIKDASPETIVFVLVKPYNRHCRDVRNRFRFVESWDQIVADLVQMVP